MFLYSSPLVLYCGGLWWIVCEASCYETPEELDFKRKVQRSQGRPPVYDRAALKLTPAEKDKFDAEGRQPHWRFFLNPQKISWADLYHGDLQIDPTSMSDPILVRENGTPVYTFCSVVDDLAFEITHILRGNDHISNTAIQIQLFEALGGDPETIQFAHLPLLVGEKGESLSKRLGSLSLQQLRQEGLEAMALNSYLSKIGTADEAIPSPDLDDLIKTFDLSKFGKSSPHFSMKDLERVNGKLLQTMDYAPAEPRLKELGLTYITEGFWLTARHNIEKLSDLKILWEICEGTIAPKIEEPEYIEQAKALLPETPWDTETWAHWTNALKTKTGRKGKNLFMPLRLALTAQSHGPEMKNLLPFIGHEKALKRLSGETA